MCLALLKTIYNLNVKDNNKISPNLIAAYFEVMFIAEIVSCHRNQKSTIREGNYFISKERYTD